MPFDDELPSRRGVRAPVRFSEALGREICARVAAGESVRSLAGTPGMPSRRCFRDWALRDPVFGHELERAKAARNRAAIARDDAQVARQVAGQSWRRLWRTRGGSQTTYTAEIGEAICARIAAGESVMSIGADPSMPCAVTIYNWARRQPVFREAYAAAKAIGADMLFDLAREVALEATEATVRSDRLRVQTLRWQIAQLAPKKYGPLALRDADRDEDGRRQFNVVIRNFADPAAGGPPWTDVAGTAIEKPDWVENPG